ncbi:MAG: type II secretion system protein [Parachlamydiales bacterium]|jgi:type II secretory pathway pseudopilin PulG
MIKKRHITLLEMMIVILLIGIITSVVGYNVKGSLDRGKLFKTEQAQKQIRDILLLEVAKGNNLEEVVKNHKKYLEESLLLKDVSQMLKDGWGDEFTIKVSRDRSNIDVISANLKKYKKTNSKDTVENEEENNY